ncbi:CHAD domain-containing protein [Endothiovibrio diazotrophicus]
MKSRTYELPDTLDLETLIERLQLTAEPLEPFDRLYLDSFDWRALNGRGVVELDRRERRIGWRDLKGAERWREIAPAKGIPRFPQELPEGAALRNRLEKLLEMRALLPQARWRGRRHPLRLEDDNGKMRVRLTLEEGRFTDSQGGSGKSFRPAPRLTVTPLRGYDKEAERLFKELARLKLPEAPRLYPEALERFGRQPGRFVTKPKLPHPPETRSDVAVKWLLHELLEVMMEHEAGTLADLDSEFLHEYRVAIRRSRSALAQMKGVFPARDTERFKRGLAWLGEITSPLRDLDVQLLKLPDYRAALPAELHDALDPLEALLDRRRVEERGRMEQAMRSARYRQLIERWRAFLEAEVPPHSRLPWATRPIAESAAARVRKMHRRAMEEGCAIGPETPDEAYHELRKTCKKLRYLMEFFLPLFPADQVAPLIAATKALHANLGEFQDVHVQLEEFASYRAELAARDELPAETGRALDALAEQLRAQRLEEMAAFTGNFAAFVAHKGAFKRVCPKPRKP